MSRPTYLALGDSISIDEYTGVEGGGAASQLARMLEAELVSYTRDGHTTNGVLSDLVQIRERPDVVSVTAGGNDLLLGERGDDIVDNLERIATRVAAFACPVIFNTVYDPTDGDDALSEQLGLRADSRGHFVRVNEGIRALARRHGFLLADLERLFHGHGIASAEPWFVLEIEPNLAGATATAQHWYALLRSPTSE